MVIFKLEQEDLDPPPPYIEDDDYDVYMFYPSISSQILIPVHGAPFVPFEATDSPILAPEGSNNFLPAYRSSASGDESQSLDELGIVLCCLPVRVSSIFLSY
ncbi:uncharacterized protein PHACADRAFT_247755 [Phanerochaete carnosa HHB-10118-sp]|uniref:Uncharacterized protein n=1 Tax=Phanerochaete carnosa (strain HHB-10118-sp) TaxID=650164 RepID=K5WPU6_PHACS|nr:uncharacterized protein PHACADRAFT_247755 [Phanerochaete carnosa HHB-10118-sp]EKM61264.1 hypothetical protein PHACADRAFT_247755 [Phanerochaete carnosa HHB-10118-sp]